MTHVNPNTAPGQPDDSESRDILDIINEAVAGITDAEIEERLRDTLDRAGYNRPHSRADDQDLMLIGCPADGTDNVAVPPAQGGPGLMHPWKIARSVIQEAEDQLTAARAARLEAEAALAGALMEASRIREESDKALDSALSEAARIDRDAQAKAERIIKDAEKISQHAERMLADSQARAEQVIEDAEKISQHAEQMLADSQARAERIMESARAVKRITRKGGTPETRQATWSIKNAAALLLRFLRGGRRPAPLSGATCMTTTGFSWAPPRKDYEPAIFDHFAQVAEQAKVRMDQFFKDKAYGNEIAYEPDCALFMGYLLDDAVAPLPTGMIIQPGHLFGQRKITKLPHEDPVVHAVFNCDGTYRMRVVVKKQFLHPPVHQESPYNLVRHQIKALGLLSSYVDGITNRQAVDPSAVTGRPIQKK